MELVDFLSVIATGSSIALYMTGWPLVLSVYRRKNTGEISTFPYVAFLVNCLIWIVYAVNTDNSTLKFVNSVGALHQIIYIIILYYYAKNKRLFSFQLGFAIIFLSGMVIYGKHELDKDNIKDMTETFGQVGVVLSVLAYASPLSAMGSVIKTRSTSSMNYPLSIANFIVGIEWTLYGYYLGDKYVLMPNTLGTLVSVVQLALFFIYPTRTPTTPLLPA